MHDPRPTSLPNDASKGAPRGQLCILARCVLSIFIFLSIREVSALPADQLPEMDRHIVAIHQLQETFLQAKVIRKKEMMIATTNQIRILEESLTDTRLLESSFGTADAIRKEIQAEKAYLDSLKAELTRAGDQLADSKEQLFEATYLRNHCSDSLCNGISEHLRKAETALQFQQGPGSEIYYDSKDRVRQAYDKSISNLNRAATAAKVTRNASVMIVAGGAAGMAAAPLTAAGYSTGSVIVGSSLSGTAGGTAAGLLSNAAKATEEVWIGQKSPSKAALSAAIATLEDSKLAASTAAVSAVGAGMGFRVLRGVEEVSDARKVVAIATGGATAGATDSILTTTKKWIDREKNGKAPTIREAAKDLAIRSSTGALTAGIGSGATLLRGGMTSMAGKALVYAGEVSASASVGIGANALEHGSPGQDAVLNNAGTAVVTSLVGGVITEPTSKTLFGTRYSRGANLIGVIESTAARVSSEEYLSNLLTKGNPVTFEEAATLAYLSIPEGEARQQFMAKMASSLGARNYAIVERPATPGIPKVAAVNEVSLLNQPKQIQERREVQWTLRKVENEEDAIRAALDATRVVVEADVQGLRRFGALMKGTNDYVEEFVDAAASIVELQTQVLTTYEGRASILGANRSARAFPFLYSLVREKLGPYFQKLPGSDLNERMFDLVSSGEDPQVIRAAIAKEIGPAMRIRWTWAQIRAVRNAAVTCVGAALAYEFMTTYRENRKVERKLLDDMTESEIEALKARLGKPVHVLNVETKQQIEALLKSGRVRAEDRNLLLEIGRLLDQSEEQTVLVDKED